MKILDFGLAKVEPARAVSADGSTVTPQQQTTPGHVLGTVGYMSPEQVRGQAADARSDIFAAGAVLYEMATGKPAFRKATSAETMSAILNEDPPATSQVAVNIPPGLQRIVSRGMAKNPEQRLQHASDLAFALEALSDSGSAPAKRFFTQEVAQFPAVGDPCRLNCGGNRWTLVSAQVAAEPIEREFASIGSTASRGNRQCTTCRHLSRRSLCGIRQPGTRKV